MPAANDRPVLRVADEELEELRSRLRGTRWPGSWPSSPGEMRWRPGADEGELRNLARYWAEGFDWRAQEAAINALPWHAAPVGGTDVCYLRFEAEAPGALPVVLTHGWPSSFLELTELARRLSAPPG